MAGFKNHAQGCFDLENNIPSLVGEPRGVPESPNAPLGGSF